MVVGAAAVSETHFGEGSRFGKPRALKLSTDYTKHPPRQTNVKHDAGSTQAAEDV